MAISDEAKQAYTGSNWAPG